MNLSNVSNIRFNGSDVKLAKINNIIVYKKEEENPLLKARYTANASGVVPNFNYGYVYEVNEVESNGVYTVEITSENDFSSCSFAGMSQLLTVEYLKVTSNVTNMSCMFYECKGLTSLDLSNWDTSNVTAMDCMFYHCISLESLDLSNLDTSKVTNMGCMFQYCISLESLDLSNLDTSKVTSMGCMFAQCWSPHLNTIDLSSFDTSKVTDMGSMFGYCNYLTSLDLSNFDTSSVTNMTDMFASCDKLTELDSMLNIRTDLNVPPALNRESILDVVNNLAPVSSTKTLKISATQLSWISEDKLIEANNKGWTISA